MLVVLIGIFLIAGCSLQVGDRVAGIQSGKFFYTDGNLVTYYDVSFEKAWNACERTILDLKASDAVMVKKIAKGTLDGVLKGEPIRFSVEYLEKNLTKVSVRVGIAGNNIASEMIQQKIKGYLEQQ